MVFHGEVTVVRERLDGWGEKDHQEVHRQIVLNCYDLMSEGWHEGNLEKVKKKQMYVVVGVLKCM